MKLNEDLLSRMREATILLQSAGPAAATAAIQRALGMGGMHAEQDAMNETVVDINPAAPKPRSATAGDDAGRLAQRLHA